MKKVLLLLVAVTLFFSCSNDDDGKQDKSGIVRLEVINSVANGFNENTSIEITSASSNTESINVTGTVWDDVSSFPYSKVFSKNGNIAMGYDFKTTQEVLTFTYSTMITKTEISDIPLITTLNFYIDGKLVKTEVVTTETNSNTTITIGMESRNQKASSG